MTDHSNSDAPSPAAAEGQAAQVLAKAVAAGQAVLLLDTLSAGGSVSVDTKTDTLVFTHNGDLDGSSWDGFPLARAGEVTTGFALRARIMAGSLEATVDGGRSTRLGPNFLPPLADVEGFAELLGVTSAHVLYLLGAYTAYLAEQGALIDVSPTRRPHPEEPPVSAAPFFACPICQRVSYNANDIASSYCGYCHAYQPPTRRAGPDLIDSSLEPGGLVLQFYDRFEHMVLERALTDTTITNPDDPADMINTIDQGLGELELVAYDGDTGSRLPLTFGVRSYLRSRPT